MTQEDKELLMRDLCARLPYGVMCDAYPWQQDKPRLLVECVPEYHNEEIVLKGLAGRHSIPEAKVKPYLRPMSSMTEKEQRYVWDTYGPSFLIADFEDCGDVSELFGFCQMNISGAPSFVDWLNENHFDYRGLIEKGLAIAVTEENNPYKK